MIDLNALEKLAQAATPGPWYCTRTIQEELGVEPHDWGQIMLTPHNGASWAPVLAKMNMHFATDEEKTAERKRSICREGQLEMRDPGQPGRDAEFIVAACNSITELIAQVRALGRQRDWLVQYYAKLDATVPCPYLEGSFDQAKPCPFWVSDSGELPENDTVESWKQLLLAPVEYGDEYIDCGTSLNVCLRFAAEEAAKGASK